MRNLTSACTDRRGIGTEHPRSFSTNWVQASGNPQPKEFIAAVAHGRVAAPALREMIYRLEQRIALSDEAGFDERALRGDQMLILVQNERGPAHHITKAHGAHGSMRGWAPYWMCAERAVGAVACVGAKKVGVAWRVIPWQGQRMT